MRYLIAVLAVLATACGGSDEPDPLQDEACAAARQMVEVAVEAYQARDQALPADMDAMVPQLVDPSSDWFDWYTVADGTVEANPDGPCA